MKFQCEKLEGEKKHVSLLRCLSAKMGTARISKNATYESGCVIVKFVVITLPNFIQLATLK